MKKAISVFVLFFIVGIVFAQQLPTVAVATFDTLGGITNDEAQVVTELFMTELVSKGTVNVVDRVNFDKIIAEMRFQTTDWSDSRKTAQLGRAINAGYIIRGQLMKIGNAIYWTATMIDVNTAQVLYSAREQMTDISDVFSKLTNFTSQMINRIPPPNLFIGKWRSQVSNPLRTCVIEFKPDGSLVIEQYEIWNGTNTIGPIIGRGYGTGNYTFDQNKINMVFSLMGNNIPNEMSIRRISSSYTISVNNLFLNEALTATWTGQAGYFSSFVKIQ